MVNTNLFTQELLQEFFEVKENITFNHKEEYIYIYYSKNLIPTQEKNLF